MDLKYVIEEFPQCITDHTLLRNILRDLYPTEKMNVNIALLVHSSGVFEQIQRETQLSTQRFGYYATILRNDYGLAPESAFSGLRFWASALNISCDSPLSSKTDMPSYCFMGQVYYNISLFVEALSQNWDEGKQQLFSGAFSEHGGKSDDNFKHLCIEFQNQNGNQDCLYFEFLCKLEPQARLLRWKGRTYLSAEDFGVSLIGKLRTDNYSEYLYWRDMFSNKCLTKYFAVCTGTAPSLSKLEIQQLDELENHFKKPDSLTKASQLELFNIAYLLSNDLSFHISGNVFTSPKQLIEYMQKLNQGGFNHLTRFSVKLLPANFTLNPQFEAWLMALNWGEKIDLWRHTYNN